VRSSTKLWEAWRLSKAYHVLPSEIYQIEHPVRQFYFNRAVWLFATNLETAMSEAAKNKKPKQAEQARTRVLSQWLGSDAAAFRTPQITR
jgi:hypothetical protein